jgi:uncharacterized membrane protein (UPF0127 family)
MFRRVAIAVLVTLVAACSSTDPGTTEQGADPTTVPAVSSPAATTQPSITPDGFERVAATVTKADGETCDLCLWLAETSEQRTQGLMYVTDLGQADGMVFVYPSPRTGTFWMKNTVLPLSIAYFDAEGTYLDAYDMSPCLTASCPRYRTAPDFLVAVETIQGGLDALGIGEGSRLELLGLPCE